LGKPTPPAGDPAQRPPAPCPAPPTADNENGATIPTPGAEGATAWRGDGKLCRKEYETVFALVDIDRDGKIDKKVESKRDLCTVFPTDVLADVPEELHASILRSSFLSLKPGEWESMNQRDRELFLQVLLLPGCF
jgi:hypothetical protein